MIIEDYKRINGWLNVRVNPKDNEDLYDFSGYSGYFEGIHHTISDAAELYEEYLKLKKENDSK